MSAASDRRTVSNIEPITQWLSVTAANLSKLQKTFTSPTPLNEDPDAAELIRRKKELTHAFHLRGLNKFYDLWEVEKEFEGGEQAWENNIVPPINLASQSPPTPQPSFSQHLAPPSHLSTTYYPPLPACTLHQRHHQPPSPPKFTVKKQWRSQRCAARAVVGLSTAPFLSSPLLSPSLARSSTPSSGSSAPRSQAFELVDVEDVLQPIWIKAPLRVELLKTLLLLTTPTGALIPVEIAVHFGTEGEKDLPLFFRKNGEFFPVSLKVEDLVRLVTVAPVSAPFKRAFLPLPLPRY